MSHRTLSSLHCCYYPICLIPEKGDSTQKKSSLTTLFLSHSAFNPSANPVSSLLETHLTSDQRSQLPLLPNAKASWPLTSTPCRSLQCFCPCLPVVGTHTAARVSISSKSSYVSALLKISKQFPISLSQTQCGHHIPYGAFTKALYSLAIASSLTSSPLSTPSSASVTLLFLFFQHTALHNTSSGRVETWVFHKLLYPLSQEQYLAHSYTHCKKALNE